MFTAQDVATLREKTGVGMMDCKKALEATDGNFDKAIEYLRERGLAAASKKAGRIAAEGTVQSYIHMGGRIGVLVEVNCETDFAAGSEQFKTLVKDIAMQIAAANPKYVNSAEVPADIIEEEKRILKQKALNEGKPEAIVERIAEGGLKKFYKENCLMDQEFVKDPSKTITQYINDAILKIGEKITVRRFVRYEMGEGLEKRNDDFAAEVAKQAQGN